MSSMGAGEETRDPRSEGASEPAAAGAARVGEVLNLPPAAWRTSASEPYRVDWIDLRLVPGLADAVGEGGGLGMGFAPGKYDTYWKHDRDLAADIDALRAVHHVDTLVLLVEDGELRDLRIAALPEAAATVGLDLVRYPIQDFGVPANRATFKLLIADLVARIRASQRVVIACKGGYGRTGTVAGVLLRAGGVGPADAVSLVRATRPGTIESYSQARFVEDWRPSDGAREGHG
jgi:protein-tyrosine phosphatase